MAIHPLNRQHKREPASGISEGAVTATGSATATALAVATDSPTAEAAPTLNTAGLGLSTPVETSVSTSSTSSSSPSSTSTLTSSAASASASSSISLGTVIGACVGALAGALILILLGLWLYRRSDPSKRRRPSRAHQRDMAQRDWNKLGDDEDKWEGMNKPKGGGEVAPMEKLEMFKKSTPSVYTTKTTSEELPPLNFDSHPFSQYHPGLAKELASADEPSAAPYKTDSTDVGGSYLSIRSNHRVSGAMSPTVDMAIPTPALTSSELHRWESAEVLNLEGQTAEVVDPDDSKNPFVHYMERRKSEHNPFFGASMPTSVPKVNKGKGREITPPQPISTNNPFADATDDPLEKTPTRPHFTHTAVSSVSSVSSNDRAIQSLIAALDTTPEEVQERLKVAEPSIISDAADSIYTTADYSSEEEGDDGEDDVTESFPLPPGGSSRSH